MTPSAAKAGDGAPQAAATTGWATSVSFEPFAAAEGGYDSNPDQRRQGRGSWYEMLQAGTRATWQRTDTEVYTGYARGRYYSFQDIDHPNRYDIDLALGARYDLSPAWVLKLGSSFYRDAVSLQSADLFRSFVELVHEGQDYQVRVNAHSHTELSLHNPPLPPGLAVDVFDTTRNNAFDYTKNGATLSLLTFRNAAVSPYLIASLADVYYMNQSPNALLDRSADDMWASLGLRLKLASTLTFDIGGRVNHRAFEQADANDFTRGFLDARLTWYATPALAFRGIVERQIKEPSTPFGLADDVSVMVIAILASVAVMMFAARTIGEFVDRHPTIKMLALSFLVLVGSTLIAEGFDTHVPKGYIYFAMAFSIGVEMLNIKLRRRSHEAVKLHKSLR